MNRSLRTLTPLSVLLALALVVASFGLYFDRGATGERVVRVGLYENPPKIYTGPDGRPTGLFIELLNGVAKAEGWSLRYESCAWSDCLQQVAVSELNTWVTLTPRASASPWRSISAPRERTRRSVRRWTCIDGSWTTESNATKRTAP